MGMKAKQCDAMTELPARKFNSKLAYEVWIVDHDGNDMPVGFTPSEEPLTIPPCSMWYISPTFLLYEKAEEFVADVNAQGILGVKLGPELIEDFATIISKLSGLKHLDIWQTQSPEVLSLLTSLKDLQSLRMGHVTTNVSIIEKTLEHIGQLRSLCSVELEFPAISANGLKHLQKLSKLQKLSIWGTKVADSVWASLLGLGELQELNIGLAEIGDEGLKLLSNLKKIRKLNLTSTTITDEGLKYLDAIKCLQKLILCGEKITDVGLGYLEEVKTLQYVYLQKSGITKAGVDKLQQALPQACVGWQK